MKLWSIRVENYRSIVKTQSLKLDDGLTVILGPNNEGKSNLLRAVVLAMECLRAVRTPYSIATRTARESIIRLPRSSYDWAVDFPLKLQPTHPEGQTILTLEFTLNEEERQQFKAACGSAINDHLPIEIRLEATGAHFKVKKPGRGGRSYGKKSQEIASFVSRKFDFQYIPAIRPSDLSLEVVGRLMERELALLANDEKYKSALRTIDDLQKPVFDRLSADVQRYLKQLLPSIKAVKIGSSQPDKYRDRFRLPKFVVNDGTATELEAKGDGIKSLVAISLMRASKAGGVAGDLVVAIEEPESHLHPGAVRQLAVVLQEMASEHQVIVTTHSPLLVARDRIESNIIVSRSKATPAESIKAVRESLGVRVQDSLSTAEYVVLLEGQTDVKALTAIFASRSPEFASLVRAGKVVFDEMEGTGNVAYKIRTLQLSVATPILITDDDKAGRDCAKKAKEAGALPDKFIFCWKRQKIGETELEDLFDPDCYWVAIEGQFGATLDRRPFNGSTEKWSKRMQAGFEASGKPWNTSIENNVKALVASQVAQNPAKALAPDRQELVENVIRSVAKIISGS
jgi:AAA15 family ATPase/GTPase